MSARDRILGKLRAAAPAQTPVEPDVAGYYAPLLALLDQARDEGFVREVHRGLLLADTDPAALLDRMAAYQAPAVVKWVEKDNQL